MRILVGVSLLVLAGCTAGVANLQCQHEIGRPPGSLFGLIGMALADKSEWAQWEAGMAVCRKQKMAGVTSGSGPAKQGD